MGTVLRFVKRQPKPIQRAYYALPFAWRYGREYRHTLRLLRDSQWWDEDRLRLYQLAQLNALVTHAYEDVPYYRRLFDARGLTPADIRRPADLALLPILTRDDIQRNRGILVAESAPTRSLIPFKTSGSTGRPLMFWGLESMWKKEAAHATRAYEANGGRLYQERSVWLRRYVPEEGQPLYRHDWELRRLYLSAYHLDEVSVRQYVQWMDDYGARILATYPSAAYIFATLCEAAGVRPKHVNLVVVASEQVLPHWQETVERVLQVPMRAHYGMMEKVSFHFQCPAGNYHEALEYGVTEIVDDGRGVGGRIIATGFLNWAMPFLRYDTGDRAVRNESAEPCPCGRGLPVTVARFEGRSDDILRRLDGGWVPAVNFYTMMYKIQGVTMFRIVQNAVDQVDVVIVPGPEFTVASAEAVVRGMRERLGDGMQVDLETVDSIERSPNTGKLRCVMCRVRGI